MSLKPAYYELPLRSGFNRFEPSPFQLHAPAVRGGATARRRRRYESTERGGQVVLPSRRASGNPGGAGKASSRDDDDEHTTGALHGHIEMGRIDKEHGIIYAARLDFDIDSACTNVQRATDTCPEPRSANMPNLPLSRLISRPTRPTLFYHPTTRMLPNAMFTLRAPAPIVRPPLCQPDSTTYGTRIRVNLRSCRYRSQTAAAQPDRCTESPQSRLLAPRASPRAHHHPPPSHRAGRPRRLPGSCATCPVFVRLGATPPANRRHRQHAQGDGAGRSTGAEAREGRSLASTDKIATPLRQGSRDPPSTT